MVSTSSRAPGSKLSFVRLKPEAPKGLELEFGAALRVLSPVGIYRVMSEERDGDWHGVYLRGEEAGKRSYNHKLFEVLQ